MGWGFHQAVTQVVFVGFLAFCGPGLYNALTSLGNAGSPTEGTSAMANGTLYICFSIVGYFSGVFFNLWGPKILMFFGGLSYAIYSLCVYYVREDRMWLAGVGGTVLGIGAGLFWTAQSALMMGYATPEKKGKYIAIFWTIFNLGGVVGGFIQFGVNFNNLSGSANKASYFTFIVMMIIGACCSLVLLAKPESVIKEDGTLVEYEKADSACREIKDALAVITEPFILYMLLFFVASNWYYTYQFSGFNNCLFNIRTRGFNSAFYWGAQMGGSILCGILCDHKSWSLKKRSLAGFGLNVVCLVVCWTGAIIVRYQSLLGLWDKYPYYHAHYDLIDTPKQWIGPFFVFLCMGISDSVFQSYAYWLMGAAAGDSIRQAARFAAVYKGVQSAGAAVAWSTDLIDTFLYRQQLWVCVVLAFVSCVPTFFPAKNIEKIASKYAAQTAKDPSVPVGSKSSGSTEISEELAPEHSASVDIVEP